MRTKISLDDSMEIGRLDAHGQAALVSRGEVSAEDLVDAAVLRIHSLNDALNAVSFRAFDAASRRASERLPKTPVACVPYLLKDSIDYTGMPSRHGSRLMSQAPATSQPPFAQRLDEAGLIPVGKASMPEFGLLPSTEPVLYGSVINPWASDRSPGGSSGGSAAAVAAGLVPVAHASDGGGSVRIPASCCGVFGFKPGRGTNVRARPPSIIEDLLCGDSMLSRSVRDCAWLVRHVRPDNCRVGPQRENRGRLRILVQMANLYGRRPHPEVAAVIERTARLCETLGHDVDEFDLPFDGAMVLDGFRTIWGFLARDVVDRCAVWASPEDIRCKLEPWTLALAEWSDGLTPLDLEKAVALVTDLELPLQRVFEQCDLLLSPVLTYPPAPLGRLAPDRAFDDLMRDMFDYIAYTPLQNLAGLPSMSVPLYMTDSGLPIGSMFTGSRWSDDLLLDFAAELEEAAPWRDRWPVSAATM